MGQQSRSRPEPLSQLNESAKRISETMSESSVQVVARYLQEAVSAARNFETQLRAFADEAHAGERQRIFLEHAARLHRRHEQLVARAESLGVAPVAAKSLLDHLFSLSPKTAHAAHVKSHTTENFIKMYAIESSEVALYEALANIAEAAGDVDTETLVRSLQREAKTAVETIWQLLPAAAREDVERAAAG